MSDRTIKAKYEYEALEAAVKLDLINAGVDTKELDIVAKTILTKTFVALYNFKHN
ncbi:MAG: hypothetical protein ACRCUJ_12925 [Phocaeicola sp.]